MSDWTKDYLVAGDGDKDWTTDYLIEKPKYQPTAALTSSPKEEEPLGPLGAGWKTAGADLRTVGASVASAAGLDEVSRSLYDQATKTREEVGRRFKPKVPSYTDISGLGDLLQYLYEQGAQSLPQMGATLGAGALGVAAAPAAVPAAVAGIGAGTLAALPFFTGQNIKEQIDEGRDIKSASLAAAAGAGLVQGALDTLVGAVLPGAGKAAAGGAIVRAVKKAIEGGLIEGTTEAAQQAIQIGQANPSKLFSFSPEVQKELAEAAVAGGLLGGTIGGASGAAHKRSSPQEVKNALLELKANPENAIPPSTNIPVLENNPQGPGEDFQKVEDHPLGYIFSDNPEGWTARGTGLPEPNVPVGLDEGLFPSYDREYQKHRLPEVTGQQVYKDVQQRLLAAGVPPMEANANSSLWKARYEALGKQLGVDAYSAYKASNVEIQGSGKGAKLAATADPSQTLNQDPIDPEAPQARHYSMLRNALGRINMKQGTGQQWLNKLTNEGVKKDELIWTGVMDDLEKFKNQKLTPDIIQHWMTDMTPAVYETNSKSMAKNYSEWTLGQYGKNPESNYREVVLSMENMPKGTYSSQHFQMIPNPVAHYRTTDRVTLDGQKVLLAEEFQSDWLQSLRERDRMFNDTVDNDFQSLVDNMKRAGVLEEVCD